MHAVDDDAISKVIPNYYVHNLLAGNTGMIQVVNAGFEQDTNAENEDESDVNTTEGEKELDPNTGSDTSTDSVESEDLVDVGEYQPCQRMVGTLWARITPCIYSPRRLLVSTSRTNTLPAGAEGA